MALPSDPFLQEDEIDLAELFSGLWAQKILVAGVAFLCVVVSMVYAFRATPMYEASAVFEITSKQSRPAFASELSGLASLAGLSVSDASENLGVFDRIAGRDFVLDVAGELALDQDRFFNPYVGDGPKETVLDQVKDLIKSVLAPGTEEDTATEDQLAKDAIVRKFQKVVTADMTDNGSFRIVAVHEDAAKAAALANMTMNRALADLDKERKEEQAKQLAYLSEQLADALTTMNDAQERVQDFALENSLVSTSAFTTRTELMFRLRDELKRSQEMQAATVKLLRLSEAGSPPTQEDYADLRRTYPIVDDVAFRRLLGIPEALDQWTWPSKTRLLEFQNIILDRDARAQRELEKIQIEAENYAKAAEELTSLKRDASIAEATYQLLIEQTKSQTFAAGFNSDLAKIYQVAVPETNPSAPRKSLVVALGAVLGLFLGAGIAILRSSKSGRLFSANAINEAARARLSARAPLRFLRSRKTGVLLDRSEKLRPGGLAALAIDLNEKSPKGVLCVSAGSQTRASGPALWIAAHLANDHARVAVVDLSAELAQSGGAVPDEANSLWQIAPVSGKIDLLTPAAPLRADDILLRKRFSADVTDLLTRYDCIVFSAAPANATMARRALLPLSFYSVVLCSRNLAQKPILMDLREITPIDACLSET